MTGLSGSRPSNRSYCCSGTIRLNSMLRDARFYDTVLTRYAIWECLMTPFVLTLGRRSLYSLEI